MLPLIHPITVQRMRDILTSTSIILDLEDFFRSFSHSFISISSSLVSGLCLHIPAFMIFFFSSGIKRRINDTAKTDNVLSRILNNILIIRYETKNEV